MNERSSSRLFFFGLAIAIAASVLIQNFRPQLGVFFLGQASIPIPLGVLMLAAFAIGGIVAYCANAIAFWLERTAPIEEDAEEEGNTGEKAPTDWDEEDGNEDEDGNEGKDEDEDKDEDDEPEVIDVKYVDRNWYDRNN